MSKEITEVTRLNFSDNNSLELAIDAGKIPESGFTRSGHVGTFVSLMNMVSGSRGSSNELTYYEALGYDSLIPNPNFAQLFNKNGELEVGNNIVKVTPVGTFIFPRESESEYNALIDDIDSLTYNTSDEIININKNLILYRTFNENMDDYELISEGCYEELPDDFFEDNDETPTGNVQTRAINEPDYNSFLTYSADRKTWVGRNLIQGIIGSSRTNTINFSKKRRVKGSFYFYNYGVYSEIGVKGWTDKKNKIGWSKTRADELRVGWKDVILTKSVPQYYEEAMKKINNLAYLPPKYMEVNGKRINVATLIMPDLNATGKQKILSQGYKALFDVLKDVFKVTPSETKNIQGFVIAAKKEIIYISGIDEIKNYNTKYYCHAFSTTWMKFEVGWSNQQGLIVNGITQNNYDKYKPYFNIIKDAFNEKKPSLMSGEVHICARFGNEWRGMKIVKKQ